MNNTDKVIQRTNVVGDNIIAKFSAVNEKNNVISGNMVAKIDEVLNAQKKLNDQGNAFKNNIFASQDNLSDATIARINSVITAQDRLSLKTRQLATDISKGGGSDALVKDVNSVIIAQERLNTVLNKPLSSNRVAEIQKEIKELNNKLVKLQEIKLMGEKFPGTSGSQISNINAQIDALTRSKQVRQEILDIQKQTNLAANTAPKAETINSSQYTDGIKKTKQDIAAIDRQLFEQLQKNNGVESLRTAELRRQKTELESQIGAIKSRKVATEEVATVTNKFADSLKSHITMMAAMAVIMATVAIPAETITRIKELEKAMAGVRQVLPELEHDQSSANAELMNFTKIAGKYGESTLEIIDAARSWGRMYKDVNVVNLLVSQSARMATADNFSLKESVKGLESAMSQFGMKSEKINEVQMNSNRILDVWTKLAHTGGASAQDLVSGVERAGSTAYQAGLSFEFFNALIATGVRNTALSGAEIGNSLKSMFINIKTDKAISELDKFGIKMKQTNADGTKSFRNTQDVLLELAMAVQTTDKDTSKLFSTLFGKFQNSKLTSIITDYKQVIENWQNAVNSSNFTDAQVAVQMDTISRKMGTTRALLDTLVAGTSNSGLATFIKEQIQSINNFLTGLQSISSNMYGVIGTTVKWTAELYLATKVLSSIGTAISATNIAIKASADVKKVDTVVTALNTEAKIAENVATANLNRTVAIGNAIRGNIVPLLILGTAAMYSYSESVGEANNKIQKQGEIESTKFEKMQRDSENIKQQSDFIVALANAYDKQSDALAAAGENTEKSNKIKEEMTFIEGKLTEELNINSDANTQNSENVVENGKINRDVIDRNLKAKELHSAELARALLQDATNLEADAKNNRDWANAKITNMENEIKMLGVLERAYLAYLKFMAGVYGKIADYQEQDANDPDVYAGVSVEKTPEQKAAKLATAKEYRDKAASYTQQRESTFSDYIGASQALRNANNEELLKSKIRSDYVAKQTDGSGGIVDDKVKKPKKEKAIPGANMQAPDDKVEKQFRDNLKHDINGKFDEDKISADKYAISLDLLNTKESILGVSNDTMSQRQEVMKKRVSELLGTSMEYKDLAGEFESQAQDIIDQNADLKADLDERKTNWKSMTKEQKESFKEQHKDFMEANKDVLALDDAASRLKVKSAELSKEASQTATEAFKKQLADQKTIYDNDIQNSNLDKENALLGLGNHYTKEQSDVIELINAVNNLHLAKDRLKQIETTLGKDNPAYKQQLVTIGQLTNQVETLEDKTKVIRQNMATMFDGMMRGTTSFKDFWKNAWMDMATEAINNIWKVNSAGSSSSFLGSIFGSLFGGKSSAKAVSSTATTGGGGSVNVGVREMGGPVKAGQPYIVGEKRPELFVPDTNGTIIPDLSMVRSNVANNGGNGNSTGGGAQVVNVNIQQNFQSLDPSENMRLAKAQNASLKADILNSIKTESAWRGAIKGAAK